MSGAIGIGFRALAASAALALSPMPVATQSKAADRTSNPEPVVEVSAGRAGAPADIKASIDIPLPGERIWRVMLDCKRAPKFVAGLQSCRITERGAGGSWDIREHVIQWLWPLPAIHSEFRSDYVLHRSIRFRRTGGSFKLLEGQWTFEPLANGGTRLKYEARVDPGFPVPDAMVRQAVKSDLPRTLKAIRDEAARPE